MADSQPTIYAPIERLPHYRFGTDGSVGTRKVRGYRGMLSAEWKPLKMTTNRDGYLQVTLTDAEGRRQVCLVHRLILEAFAGPCPKGREGCHLNGDRTDNRTANLYWGTRSDNQLDRHAHARGDFGTARPRKKRPVPFR